MLEKAKAIAESAERAAEKIGIRVVVSIVDTHGNPLLLHRMDGAPLHALDIAFKKAYTAASFAVETESLGPRVQPGADLYGLAVNSGSKLIAFGGGAPTELAEGVMVGVGVSGGSTEEDIEVLNAALAAG